MNTPGPWKHVVNEIIGGHGDVVADVTGGEGNRFVDPEDNIECLANARLIAAAPDLLVALEATKEWMEDCLMDRQQKDLPSRKAYDKVAAAIAKAKGTPCP